jgi:superfamily II DNA/RNA helicase
VDGDSGSSDDDEDAASEEKLHAMAAHATMHLPPWRFYAPLLHDQEGSEGHPASAQERRPNPPVKAKDIPSDMAPALVFCSSGKTVKRVAKMLQGVAPTLKVAALHSKLAPVKRVERMQQLHRGDIQVLVATDLAARGLDTLRVKHVVQFDAASDAVSYLHRVGRTGRMGALGRVTHLLTPVNAPLSKAIADAQAMGASLEGVFSRKRSLRRKRRKADADAASAAAAATESGTDSDREQER